MGREKKRDHDKVKTKPSTEETSSNSVTGNLSRPDHEKTECGDNTLNDLEDAIISRAARISKTRNAESWDEHTEYLLQSWGDKAFGSGWLHTQASMRWATYTHQLTIIVVFINLVSSLINFAATIFLDENTLQTTFNIIMLTIGYMFEFSYYFTK